MDTTVTIGTTNDGRKVHMAWRSSGQILCALSTRGAVLDQVIAELPEGGEPETIEALMAHRVAASRLCAHCFSLRLRRRLIAAVRSRDEQDSQPPVCEHRSEARFVTLVDRERQSKADPYGDVEGPAPVARIASMRLLLCEYVKDAEPGRYALAFLHADRCRT